MGYMGLDHSSASDRAADFTGDIRHEVGCRILREVDRLSNEYNTDGRVNVAFLFNEMLTPPENWLDEKIYEGALKCADLLTEKIKKSQDEIWDSEENKNYHIKHYKRLLNSVNNYIQVYKDSQP